MTRSIAILILIFGAFHFGQKVAVLTNYAIDYEYISKVLCINKNKPKSKCNGKCHLSKELKKVEAAQENEPKASTVNQISFLFYFFNPTEEACSVVSQTHEIKFPEFNRKQLEFFGEIPVPPPSIS